MPNLQGEFSVSCAYEEIGKKNSIKPWHTHIWRQIIHPKVAGIAWEILQNCVATDDNMRRRNFNIVSRCVM